MAKKFFSYDLLSGFELHDTDEQARKYAESAIEYYRSNASEEWPEEIDHVCWGEIRQRTAEINTTAETGQDFETCDYQLADC